MVMFVSALVGGALVTLLSFIVQAVDTALARMVAAASVGFLLATGAFAHVVVTAMHLLFGLLGDAHVRLDESLVTVAVVVVGNAVGGLGFVTLSHIAQARAEE